MLDEEFDRNQYEMILGSQKTLRQKLMYYITYPKLFTSLYNQNGLQTFSSSWTVISCFGIVIYLIALILILLYPLLNGGFVERKFIRAPLTNMVGYSDPVWGDTFWNKYIGE